VELVTQIAEVQGCALVFGAYVGGHQNAQAGAVDVFYVGHVEDDFFLAFGDQGFHLFA
jgi:hypothetical protein